MMRLAAQIAIIVAARTVVPVGAARYRILCRSLLERDMRVVCRMPRQALVTVPILTLLFTSTLVRGADWPMFGRDRTRNAASLETGAPVTWQVEVRDKSGTIARPAW